MPNDRLEEKNTKRYENNAFPHKTKRNEKIHFSSQLFLLIILTVSSTYPASSLPAEPFNMLLFGALKNIYLFSSYFQKYRDG